MDLENYFEFFSEDDIRIKGTRIGIEIVLADYLQGSSPEEIAARYLSLSLEQVYATLIICGIGPGLRLTLRRGVNILSNMSKNITRIHRNWPSICVNGFKITSRSI